MPREPSYAAQLGAVLRRRDAPALKQFLLASAQRFGDERQVADVQQKSNDEMQELLHRMIVARPDLQDLHRASREWLFRHGIDAYGESGERRN
jgi:predicted ATPase